jgi:hypothetical protein
MSINSVSGSVRTSDLGALVQRLVAAADTNQDGDLSASEFGSFLGSLVKGITSRTSDPVSPGIATPAAAAAPIASPLAASAVGSAASAAAPAGWDQKKWADPEHHSTKYDVGRVLAKFPATTAGLKQAWQELATIYPDAKFDGKDTISGLPGTNGPVDVLVGASQGGTGWSWQDGGS